MHTGLVRTQRRTDRDKMKQLYLYFFQLLSATAMAVDTNLEEVLHTGNNQFTANMFSVIISALVSSTTSDKIFLLFMAARGAMTTSDGLKYCVVAKENPGKSVVLSAFSVMTPLAQLALASVGPSHDELLNSMGLPNDNVTKGVFSLVDTKLKSIQGVELKTANKVYIPLTYELNSEYAAVSRDVFHSEVGKVDFLENVATAKEINTWVEEQTNHRIKDLVDPDLLGPNTRAVLVNALYFKGAWKTPFAKVLTKDQNFHVAKDQVIKVPMMFNKADFKYKESETLKSKILEMPYEGQKSSMLLVLPDEVDGIGALLEKLKDLSILDNEVHKNFFKVEVEVHIPKFKIETTTDLKEVLQKMNVKKVFKPNEAKLDKLLVGASDLYVSDALQKAFIEVNEEGAEAAAANVFGISYLSAMINAKEYRFNADHPFLFFLKEEDNILFSGIYYG